MLTLGIEKSLLRNLYLLLEIGKLMSIIVLGTKLCFTLYIKIKGLVVFDFQNSVVLPSREAVLLLIIIWLAPRAGKMNKILCCDWLPVRARWSHLARSGLPALSRKKNFPKSHIINPLLTKLVRSRWLDIGLVHFLRVYGPRLRLGP